MGRCTIKNNLFCLVISSIVLVVSCTVLAYYLVNLSDADLIDCSVFDVKKYDRCDVLIQLNATVCNTTQFNYMVLTYDKNCDHALSFYEMEYPLGSTVSCKRIGCSFEFYGRNIAFYKSTVFFILLVVILMIVVIAAMIIIPCIINQYTKSRTISMVGYEEL
jgi:hypothetical protein